MIEDLEINRCNSKIFFSISSNIKRSYKPQTKILTDKNGTLITDEKQIVNEFKDFFEKLLNRPPHNTENEEIEWNTIYCTTKQWNRRLRNLLKTKSMWQ